eukprot:TRINITY_DN9141_c0_g1_i1.p1 TRINITY_DN9141_c0_g1~~TRINITY_DN9141_c0_g1_i1.p1  ORF type:complete len:694 (-),score=157.19 TRINITY_DN9141_c0_g1_i1:28-2109(-)
MGEDFGEELEEQLLQLVGEANSNHSDVMLKLLDSESSLSSIKMKEWLMKKGVSELLLTFVTRTQPDTELQSSLHLDSAEFLYSSERRREALLERVNSSEGDSDSEDEMGLQFTAEAKRADKAAEVFVHHAATFPSNYIDSTLPSLVKELFNIFEVKAEGDFDNFDKVFQSLFNPYGARIISLLSSSQENASLVLHLLNYLHDPAISDTLMLIMKTLLPEQQLVTFYNSLNENGFFTYLGNKIYGDSGLSSFEEASNFFVQLVEACSSYNSADVLFKELGQNFTFVDGLINGICNTSGKTPKEQQVACIHALRALVLKSGEQLFDQSLDAYTQTPLPNMLRGIRVPIHQRLHDKVKLLSEKILNDAHARHTAPKSDAEGTAVSVRYATYTVKHPLSMATLSLLEVLLDLTEENPTGVLQEFPAPMWKLLGGWCLENKFNNIYHSLFYRFFLAMMKANHTQTIKALLSGNSKFLGKLIDHYSTTDSKTSGFRGYIIKMSNYLRLLGDTQAPGDFLKDLLLSHAQWQMFVPILKEETIAQIVTDYPAPANVSPFSAHQEFGSYGAKPLKPVTKEDVDIELGSKYANALGFEGKTLWVPAPHAQSKTLKNKRRRQKLQAQKKGAKANKQNPNQKKQNPNQKKPNPNQKRTNPNQNRQNKNKNPNQNRNPNQNKNNQQTQKQSTPGSNPAPQGETNNS